MPKTAQLLEDSLLVIWNDRDAANRLEAMKKTYAPDVHFFEGNMGEPVVGHQAMNALIDKLQTEWPVDFQFALAQPSGINHQLQIITWTLGPKDAQPVAQGKYVSMIESNLIHSLYLFMDFQA